MNSCEKTIRNLEQEVATLTSRAALLDAESQTCKMAEGALRTSEMRYRRLFEAAKDGILILDADTGQIVDANPFVLELLGYSHEELCGRQLWEIGAFRDVASSMDSFAELQAKGYVRYEDLPLKTRDGRTIDVEFISNVYRVESSSVIQCNIRNISDRKRAEEALREKEFLLSESQRLGHVGSWLWDMKGPYHGRTSCIDSMGFHPRPSSRPPSHGLT